MRSVTSYELPVAATVTFFVNVEGEGVARDLRRSGDAFELGQLEAGALLL